MAIYHLEAKPITRSQGHEAVKAAAYRAAERLHDERADKTHDYSHKGGVLFTEIVIPDQRPGWMEDRNRERLWNEVEKADKRKDAQLAKEYVLALPRELTLSQQAELVHGWVEDQFAKRGLVADIALHESDAIDGEKNPHAHVMIATRLVTDKGFGAKWRDIDKKETLHALRASWADAVNAALAAAGTDARVTHQSHKDRGLDVKPTVHKGKDANALEKNGKDTKIARYNRRVGFDNRMRPYDKALDSAETAWAFQPPAAETEWNKKLAEWQMLRASSMASRDATQKSMSNVATPPSTRTEKHTDIIREQAKLAVRQSQSWQDRVTKSRQREPELER